MIVQAPRPPGSHQSFEELLALLEQRLREGDGRAIVETLAHLDRECPARWAEVELLRLASAERLAEIDPELAVELYASFTSRSPRRSAVAAARLGDLHERFGRHAQACEAYEAALGHLDQVVGSPGPMSGPRAGVPACPSVDANRVAEALSLCYEARGDLDRALLWAERALERHPFETMCGNCAAGRRGRERARLEELRESLRAGAGGR